MTALVEKTIGQKYIEKYPDRIPIIINPQNVNIRKTKFLVSNDCTMGYLVVCIRKHMSLKPEESMIIFINNTIPKMTDTLGELHRLNMNPDDYCLHVTVTKENVFG